MKARPANPKSTKDLISKKEKVLKDTHRLDGNGFSPTLADILLLPEHWNAEIINSIQQGLVAQMDLQDIYTLFGDKLRNVKNLGNKIETSLADNGPGIPQEIKEKIFEPLFTTKPIGQGTGLGLSLSYDIIKAHGGELKVKTEEGEGTEFIISLPIEVKKL